MGICEVCGNHYEDTFKVVMHNKSHDFDCFQCAIQSLAPACGSCSCRILGQGVVENGFIYCGTHCLRMARRSLYNEEFNPMP
jgi:hypothetical protein